MSPLSSIPRVTIVNLKQFVQNSIAIRSYCTKYAFQEPHDGPVHVLAQKVQTGELKVDIHQEKVTEALQNLYDTIQSYTPSKPVSKSLFSWLRSGKNDTDLDSLAPKGLYIHGSVGGGKTTLMDLFYDCCTTLEHKKRVHFNSFMTEVHAKIHDVKEQENRRHINDGNTKPKPFDPTKPVADMISDNAWLICFDEFQV